MKKILLTCFVILFASPALAQTDQEFERFTKNLASQAIAIVTKKVATDVKISEFRELFLKNCELKHIGRFVLAQYWKDLNEGEREAFLDAFSESVIMGWAVNFNSFHGGKLNVASVEKSENPKSNHYFVNSTMRFNDGTKPAQVVWREKVNEEGKIMVVDIIIEGVSMAMTYRNEYRTILQRNNGNINELISSLNEKAEKLKADFK